MKRSAGWLQWGRGLKTAENCDIRGLWQSTLAASMGPRSEDRGNGVPRWSVAIAGPGFNGAAV